MAKNNKMNNQFDIGDFVIVKTQTIKRRSNKKVTWIDSKYSKPRLGRIVGLCRRFDGDIEIGPWVKDYDDSWDAPRYLNCTKENILYEIRLGWFNKPIYVQLENMRLAKLDEIKDLPMLFTNVLPWSEESRNSLREDIKNAPRDKTGRFIKL